MIVISEKAEEILKQYRKNEVDTKTPQENGRSAFWNWYDVISQDMHSIEHNNAKFGYHLQFQMKYWGIIFYSKVLLNNALLVVVEDFKFDQYNFANWLNHAPLNEVPFTKKLNKPEAWINTERPIHPIFNKGLPVCKPLGAKGIYMSQTSNGKWFVCDKHLNPIGNKNLYDGIKRFRKYKDGTYAIGFVQNRTWKIGTNGLIILPNTNISVDKQGNYIGANGVGADYVSETKKNDIDRIIIEVLNRYLGKELLRA